MRINYTIEYSLASRDDIKRMRRYIVKTFKYLEYGKNFTKKMKEARLRMLDAPLAYHSIELEYRGYDIRLLVHKGYLFFYTTDITYRTIYVVRVLQEGMDWMRIIKRWIKEHEEDE